MTPRDLGGPLLASVSRSFYLTIRILPAKLRGPIGLAYLLARASDTIADSAHDPVQAFELDEMKHVLADAINRMPDRERLVLTLYYYEGLTLSEIGQVLGVTESRVCQIHTKAIFQLRGRLSEPERPAVR